MKQTIGIIGGGEIGSALKEILKNKKNLTIFVWDKDENRIQGEKDFSYVVKKSDILFLCVPSWVLQACVRELLPLVSKDTPILSVTKGILRFNNDTKFHLTSEFLEISFSKKQFGLLSGPMLSKELKNGLAGAAVCASKNQILLKKVEMLFKNTALHIACSRDTRGVSLCGVLKNIYAIVLGVADGLGLGCNTRGILVQMAFQEMQRIVSRAGGKRETVFSYAGIGDFIATSSSHDSKNYTVGKELAHSGVCTTESEGKASFEALRSIVGLKNKKEFPLFHLVGTLLSCKQTPQKALNNFFNKT